MNPTDIHQPIIKATSAITAAVVSQADVADQVAQSAAADANYSTWLLVASVPWSTIASIAATLYTALLISEWVWKKIVRPFCVGRGWLKPIRHRIISVEEYDHTLTGGDPV